MPTVADCLRQHAPAYLKQFGEDVPIGHRKVISSITRCRTGELGNVKYQPRFLPTLGIINIRSCMGALSLRLP